MTKTLIIVALAICFLLQTAAGQANGPVSLDQIVTNSGNGGAITVPSVTPAGPHEAGFLLVTGSYGGTTGGGATNCPNGNWGSFLTGVSAPWVGSYYGPDAVFYGSGAMPNYGPGQLWGTQAFTIMDLPSSSIGATASAVWPYCYQENDWGAVLALVKNQDNGAAKGLVVNGTLVDGPISLHQPTTTLTAAGWGNGQSSPSFLIGYITIDGGDSTPDATISDAAGNSYQIIADTTVDPENLWPWTWRTKVFICPNFYNPTGIATITATAPSSSGDVLVGAVLLGPSTPAPSMVDPVPDLMSGASVTANPGTSGRPVQGLAADGVAEVVIRVPTPNVGDQVTMTLMNDQNNESNSADDDGGLGKLGGASVDQNQLTVTSVDSGQGAYAFALYKAPVDFVRQAYQDSDSGLASRSVSLNIQNTTSDTSATLPIQILRSPLILIHGKGDSWRAWDNFGPFVNGPTSTNSLFSVGRVDYSLIIGDKIASTDPVLPHVSQVKASEMGLLYNAPNVLKQIVDWINLTKLGKNPLGIPIAAVQADVVAHSMGGLIAREVVLLPNFLASRSTFGQGSIHKLITIDTPHLGSQLALNILGAQETGCLRNLLAVNGSYALNSVTLQNGLRCPGQNGSQCSGATGDLAGDDLTTGSLSPAISALNQSSPHPLPFAPIGGYYTYWEDFNNSAQAAYFRNRCSHDPLAQSFTSSGWQALFHNEPSDAIVTLKSQDDGLDGSDDQFSDAVHSPGTERLGFLPPSVLDGGAVGSRVLLLLNRSWKNPSYFYTINP
jgi:pimeloyl-ACP methyl ester carboxylesterase